MTTSCETNMNTAYNHWMSLLRATERAIEDGDATSAASFHARAEAAKTAYWEAEKKWRQDNAYRQQAAFFDDLRRADA